jgi:protein phosphatase PTC1
MEDAAVVAMDIAQSTPFAHFATPINAGFFAVYDGHGGREAVSVVERVLHDHLRTQLASLSPAQALSGAFHLTDKEMANDPACLECGSTAVCALILPGENGERVLHCANAGDSRAVLGELKGERYVAKRISFDHKPDEPSENTRVARAGGWVMCGRLDGSLAVSRALGDFVFKDKGLTCEPYVQSVEIRPEHKFLILACDGLFDVVTDDEAVRAVQHLNSSKHMAKALLKMAMERGTTDNVTVMVILLQTGVQSSPHVLA